MSPLVTHNYVRTLLLSSSRYLSLPSLGDGLAVVTLRHTSEPNQTEPTWSQFRSLPWWGHFFVLVALPLIPTCDFPQFAVVTYVTSTPCQLPGPGLLCFYTRRFPRAIIILRTAPVCFNYHSRHSPISTPVVFARHPSCPCLAECFPVKQRCVFPAVPSQRTTVT